MADARPVAAAPDAAVTSTKLPDFGCLAWSPSRRIVACVLGTTSVNRGDTDVALVFVALATDVEVPEPITLVHRSEGEGPGDGDVTPEVAGRLADALRGLEPIDHSARSVAWQRDPDGSARSGPATTTGGVRLAVRFDQLGTGTVAPSYHLVVSADGRVIADQSDTFASVTIRAFAIGGAVIVENLWNTGDEGVYSRNGDAWRCSRAGCEPAAMP